MSEQISYCPALWQDVFIQNNGDVFSCCHKRPKVIGNIYKKKLHKIFNDQEIRILRKMSLQGNLSCYQSCTLIEKPSCINPPAVKCRRVHISFGTLCNINCIMCIQDHFQKEQLDPKVLIKNIDFKHIEDLYIEGGEPLCIPNIKDFIKHINKYSKHKKKLWMLTNGTLIDGDWAKLIANSFHTVKISLNAATKETHELVNHGSQWEQVLKNIQLLKETKNTLKTSLNIVGRMTIVPENIREVPLFINKHREFGFEHISFGYVKNTVPKYLEQNPSIKEQLSVDIKKALNDNVSYDPLRLKLLGLI